MSRKSVVLSFTIRNADQPIPCIKWECVTLQPIINSHSLHQENRGKKRRKYHACRNEEYPKYGEQFERAILRGKILIQECRTRSQ